MVDQQTDLVVQWSYHGCDREDEARLSESWRTHSERLKGKLSALEDAVGPLNIVIERDTDNELWRSHAALYTPGSVLMAEVESSRLEDMVEEIIAALSGEISQHLEKPATDRRLGNFQGLESALAALHQQGRSEAFMRFCMPLVASVGPYVRRELQVREINGEIAPANITPTDIMDDVLLEAWTAFPQRQPGRDLELWLLELAEMCLSRAADPSEAVSLNDRVPVPSPNQRNSRMDEWVEQVSYFDRMELGRMLEAERSISAWDEETFEQTQQKLAEVLGDMSRDERQALILNAGLGFSINDIADFQSRARSDVEELVGSASQRLRNDRRFEDLRDLEEQMARQDIRNQRKRHSAQR